MNYTYIGEIDKNKIGFFNNIIITTTVILTYERLNNHILKYHKDEFQQINPYLKNIVENLDYVIEDNMHSNTLIFLKHINEINKKARIVIKLAKTYLRWTILPSTHLKRFKRCRDLADLPNMISYQ